MRASTEPAGAENSVFNGWGRPVAQSWWELGATVPRAALFVVGDREHWYASAAFQPAQVAWLTATDPGRETAICLGIPGYRPPASRDDAGRVRRGRSGARGARRDRRGAHDDLRHLRSDDQIGDLTGVA